MKMKTKIKSKLSRAFAYNFSGAYEKFTMSHMNEYEGVPETVLTKPLKECTVALVSTAGVHLKSDLPFDVDNPAGDHTFRLIPGDADEKELTVTHIYYDTKFAKTDPSIVFPLQQLRDMAETGDIGAVASANIGLNGGILDTQLVEQESIPQVVKLIRNENIDIVLLVPG
ncbi:glycine/sarcosine/betaine reductase selenoprotein B family protein [Planococcus sp. N028]|uniref:Glycine/sarcosine/betaine reductase selenoprotein B family protein n=1 Tax=Planococcus shixiaomingii TaxID=3058393 RepID=A0ABT8MYP2_9BACL|nr:MULTISPECIES: glycine/sarcosine/betaine reductase selenoprotein B family protein [unclassified Planococcus (in: firmicutes)]MDN7240767.1 glycine/sarcosine/betaine reductase selenoprotein B family protein [Planococcus sp. N028]WKA56672.1 glycine/sarcosine/betaine reductase selenoprotein B family protein [Planococcus sp. N022]